MSHQPDGDSVLFLSKREGTGTGHFTSYSGTVGIGVEQLEQVTFPPIRSCSRCWNRSTENGLFFEVFFDRAIPTTLEQVKKGAKQNHPFALFVLLRLTDKRWTGNPLFSPRESTRLSASLSSLEAHEIPNLHITNRLINEP
jgi:hypothetical protein